MANKNRLLIIEDDFDVAEMLLIYFESQKYEVLHADNGTDGIELARTKFPNLILLDVMLPDMDGYEICYRLRHMSLTKYIPTLFLTQKDERSSKVKGLELGADDYITKPFDIDELRLRVEGGIRRATRENLTETRSGLPTGTLIQEERAKGKHKTALTFRLHGFQAYTDVYSFIAASDALYHAGQTIRDVLSELGQNNDFVGIVDDDFIVLTNSSDVAMLEQKITDNFNKKVRTFYSFADAEQGGIKLPDNTFVPMMSLTTGLPSPIVEEPKDDANSAFSW
ncbi:MAG: response regulator transcription factor [Phototrophicaceae bacterium]